MRASRIGLFAIAAALAAVPLSAAWAYVFTITNTGMMGGNPAQDIYSLKIASNGSTGPSGSGSPTSFAVNWNASTGGGTFVDANAVFTVQTFTPTALDFKVVVNNDSTFSSARLTAIGLALTQNITGSTVSGSTVFQHVDNSNFPSFSNINVCVYSGNNCAGAGNTGLTVGSSTTFFLDLTGASGTFGTPTNLAANINVFGTKWQGEHPLSYELPGRPRVAPEPASFALLGVALLGLAATRWRQAAKSRSPHS